MITSKDDYQYVITDDSSLAEVGKINIVFDYNNIKDADALLKGLVLGSDLVITLQSANGYKKVNVRDIEYFEALENDVYAIVGKIRYDCVDKLYALEEKLKSRSFVRTSKSFLVNITKIDYIKPLLNYKLLLVMNNGDKIDVNRTYMKSFKEALEL